MRLKLRAGPRLYRAPQALAVRSMVSGGDVFSRMRARLRQSGLSVPLQILRSSRRNTCLRRT